MDNQRDTLADILYNIRENVDLWWIGVAGSRLIFTSLRGWIIDGKWTPKEGEESASCCYGLEDDDAKEHCATLLHIQRMLDENYTDEEIAEQIRLYNMVIEQNQNEPELLEELGVK